MRKCRRNKRLITHCLHWLLIARHCLSLSAKQMNEWKTKHCWKVFSQDEVIGAFEVFKLNVLFFLKIVPLLLSNEIKHCDNYFLRCLFSSCATVERLTETFKPLKGQRVFKGAMNIMFYASFWKIWLSDYFHMCCCSALTLQSNLCFGTENSHLGSNFSYEGKYCKSCSQVKKKG